MPERQWEKALAIIGHNIREKKIIINIIAQIKTSIYRIHKLRKIYLVNSNMVFGG